ncbi:CLUMA_CG001476, isoform A [Clunio marinus]|uniref:CLUMA_CG001476, isoform A n=1 Tax=Clunio marinus TaxID=568069 RepID=A0A1J1HI47_9DIPT|nr:CLUMA_CG001476, isoform A [Clunio marinus]
MNKPRGRTFLDINGKKIGQSHVMRFLFLTIGSKHKNRQWNAVNSTQQVQQQKFHRSCFQRVEFNYENSKKTQMIKKLILLNTMSTVCLIPIAVRYQLTLSVCVSSYPPAVGVGNLVPHTGTMSSSDNGDDDDECCLFYLLTKQPVPKVIHQDL